MENNSLSLPLTLDTRHALRFDVSARGVEVALLKPNISGRSPLHEALHRHLRFGVAGQQLAFPHGLATLSLPASDRLSISLGQERPIHLAYLERGASFMAVSEAWCLSPFESRFLAENGVPHPVPSLASSARPILQTDLHVHFAGCVAPQTMIELAMSCGVFYPAELLQEAGIEIEGPGILISDLTPHARETLGRAMTIPFDRQIPFRDMERIYRLRSPIAKNRDAFIPLLRRIATDYAGMGVRYVELSFSNVLDADVLRRIHRDVPAIERETGVRIRFLAALWRHSDLEWDLDCLERIHALGRERYIAGVDYMGHETNSTSRFAGQLRRLAAWADAARPGFVIRVHAGENPAHPENVRVVLDCLAGSSVCIRIGHGLYGADEQTLTRLRETRTIVEFNLNSNFALNNVQSADQVPLKKYVDHGIQVVLGTDGYGIYQTTLQQEAQAARLCGLTDSDFRKIQETEELYLRDRSDHESRHTAAPDEFVIPENTPGRYYTPEVIARKHAAQASRNEALRAALERIGCPLVDDAAVERLLRGRLVVSFAGAWKRSWERISDEHKSGIADLVDQLLAGWDPDKTVLIAGGSELGLEGLVFIRARRLGFVCLGTLVWETPLAHLARDHMTHARIVGETLYDKVAGLYNLLRDYNGVCLFIGGGPIVGDEIQAASNLRLRYLLMDGPAGASSEHARQQPALAFRTAADVQKLLLESPTWQGEFEPYWYLGANPTVDIVLTRGDSTSRELEVLLIRRSSNASAEPGKWALPGGFQLTDAPRGTPWRLGQESASTACLRELWEETGLDLKDLESQLRLVGVYEGNGRDPRDTLHAWSRSQVFAVHLPADRGSAVVAGGDDAAEAQWFRVSRLPGNLAFDHQRILRDGLRQIII